MVNNKKNKNIKQKLLKDDGLNQEDKLNFINLIHKQNKKILDLEETLINIKKRERDIILRAKAEVENIKRFSLKDIEKANKFALENFSNELLPIIDSLYYALKSYNTSDFSAVIEGIKLTLKLFLKTISKFGIDEVNEINVPFNPEIHQAITVVESNDYLPNYIVSIIQKGYILNGRLLRPAMVSVSKAK
ncbi:MAG: nucleotide exchange factor GrpE [Enterobacterales bacterium]